jgi:hypothetical protein
VRNTGSLAEMSDGFTGISSSAEKDSLGTSGAAECQLVKGQALTTSGNDASTGSLSESKRSDGELGDIKISLVVGDGANNDGDLVISLTLHVTSNAGHRQGWAVCAAHGKALQDSLVKGGLRAASQKSVELHQQKEVRVLRDWCSSVAILGVLMLKINTLRVDGKNKKEARKFKQATRQHKLSKRPRNKFHKTTRGKQPKSHHGDEEEREEERSPPVVF